MPISKNDSETREPGTLSAVRVSGVIRTWSRHVPNRRFDARSIRIAVFSSLPTVSYGFIGSIRPNLGPITAGRHAANAAAGFLNGVLGGLTGLAGIVVTIWCGLRGWPKEAQRTIFQPVAVAVFLMSALARRKGTVTAETAKLFVMGLPCGMVAGPETV